ncbi:MAG: ring-cleaving dioxygenase [Opitutaceae bacterium]
MEVVAAGLHHLTAVTADPRANLRFYTRVLGLRLVKRTVNFDDPSAYHLYYGDAMGTPGTLLTFFHWPGAKQGRLGSGQVAGIQLSAAPGSLQFWAERLEAAGHPARPGLRFGEPMLITADPDGIAVEILGLRDDPRPGWNGADVPAPQRLRGMAGAELRVRDAGRTLRVLRELLGWRDAVEESGRRRLVAGPGQPGHWLDLVGDAAGEPGRPGTGTVHHLALRVADAAASEALRARLVAAGASPSPLIDRTYFRSVYFREPGGILLEVATDGPGFLVDETADTLGTALMLPPAFEPARAAVIAALPALDA